MCRLLARLGEFSAETIEASPLRSAKKHEQVGRRGQAGAQDGGEGNRILGLLIDRLIDRSTLIARQDVGHPIRRRILSGGRNLLSRDVRVLEDGDHGVREPIIGLDGGVDVLVGRELLLEDRPTGSGLRASSAVVRRASLQSVSTATFWC